MGIETEKLMAASDRFDIAFLQIDPSQGRSLEALGAEVENTGGDLVLLPEMFATGFRTDAAQFAQPMDGPIATAMREWAVRGRKAVVGTVAVVDEGRYCNRMLFAGPSGELAWCDKRHLFRPGGENERFTPGDRRTVVEYGGLRFLLLTCYDLRFPVWSRCRGDYDVILYSAAWPASRRDVWRTLLRARAIENQAIVVGADFAGADAFGRYAGCSAVVDWSGEVRAEGAAEAEDRRTVTIRNEELNDFRTRFPAWMEADDFTLG